MSPLSLHAIYRAQQRLAPYLAPTPLPRSTGLSELTGFDVWLKLENRQHTGSFKLRGALNKILSLSDADRARGVVAASAGNHALGVAHAAQVLNLPRVDVFVQANAAPAKIAKLRRYPIDLHLVGERFDEAQAAALEFAAQHGGTFISAYDDLDVIAGQGTIGLEMMAALPDLDTIVVPTGGGGLIAGIAVVAKSLNPLMRVIGVNATASPSGYLSKRDGYPYETYANEPTLAHGLAGGFGRVPFMTAMMLIDDIVLVSEDELKQAISILIDTDQLLAEASGAAGVAALLAGKVRAAGRCAAVITGGNIDAATLRSVLNVNESSANLEGTSTNNIESRTGVIELTSSPRMAGGNSAPYQSRSSADMRQRPGLIRTPNDPITYRLIGLAMEVHNELGPGHREAAYHNALVAKLQHTDLRFYDEPEIEVTLDDGAPVQKYVPDLIVEDTVIVELKTHRWAMSRDEEAQIYDYFAGTNCEEALYFNFGRPRLEKHRLLRPPHVRPRRWSPPG